ncbi:UDP-N-acetyl-alpha-D-glucosamine C6 dehydratase [Rhodobacteraceae bacterium THAF1]|uniref:polysaccharide biosynthesis protein n=1 Tax=Palleronia sp. THAF1 TaxID=2587842 RepID=UPI000F3B3B57|nr:nucleoside-diphosphate sugar epimerase/dehydratase [Palleronia sp. THAF1]QFU10074.1 UDP-N-acetyl-alpha-D-glucosamine C6 dehydratase [Palleronia sp. THAF1]VDC17021.1 UDP-N-acetyl-alpha-D-glucosamine C6 dehydratase [Rhodobacteraceae bacterium THAF1]
MYNRLIQMPRRFKRAILLGIDVALAPVSLGLALALRYGMTSPWSLLLDYLTIFGVVTATAPLVVILLGVHRIKLENLEVRAIGMLAMSAVLLGVTAITASYLFNAGTPRSVPLIFAVLYFVLCLAARSFLLVILNLLSETRGQRQRAVIYGAGSAGIQIAAALRASNTLRPIMFVDDSPSLQGLQIAGLRVRRPSELKTLVARHRIDIVVLALPTIDAGRRETIVREIGALDVAVKMLPSHAELLERGGIEEKLRPVVPDDLLGRDKVDLNVPEVARAYDGRNVMVTGAGGSIGSELCRQLLDCRPRRIILFEHSEFALYQIDQELRAMLPAGSAIEICTRMGSVTNPARVRTVIREQDVNFILHAAAYKHVPLVEENELEGARNNMLGTSIVAEAAIAAGVKRFVLVSTDKAVRPTNVMGATKRLAEMVIQDLQTRTSSTKFAMVRFGNVLGSSGSVLPLFQRQIERGGPVTVTHPDVTRFFMTIPEAARLVLLAGAFAEGGDVFVLDMGRPMRVMDIARRLIELSGRQVKGPGTPDGIAIEVTGLRPGEKLFEELLIDEASVTATPHPKIMRAKEERLSQIETAAMIRGVSASLDSGDSRGLRRIISRYVRGFSCSVAQEETKVEAVGAKD